MIKDKNSYQGVRGLHRTPTYYGWAIEEGKVGHTGHLHVGEKPYNKNIIEMYRCLDHKVLGECSASAKGNNEMYMRSSKERPSISKWWRGDDCPIIMEFCDYITWGGICFFGCEGRCTLSIYK